MANTKFTTQDGLVVGNLTISPNGDISTQGTLTVSGAAITGSAGEETLTNKTLVAPVISSPTGLVKADVGLSNVDNTTDANKPISSATQSALDGKQVAGTYATGSGSATAIGLDEAATDALFVTAATL